LQQEVTKAAQSNAAITTQYFTKVKEALVKEGLDKPESTLKDNKGWK
jgi:hypothetical protein